VISCKPQTVNWKFLTVRCQSRTQGNACARTRKVLALGKLNFSCAVIGLTFINSACRQRTGTPKFKGSGCQFPQSQGLPSTRTGISLGKRLVRRLFRGGPLEKWWGGEGLFQFVWIFFLNFFSCVDNFFKYNPLHRFIFYFNL
jgi:hypothetical protein